MENNTMRDSILDIIGDAEKIQREWQVDSAALAHNATNLYDNYDADVELEVTALKMKAVFADANGNALAITMPVPVPIFKEGFDAFNVIMVTVHGAIIEYLKYTHPEMHFVGVISYNDLCSVEGEIEEDVKAHVAELGIEGESFLMRASSFAMHEGKCVKAMRVFAAKHESDNPALPMTKCVEITDYYDLTEDLDNLGDNTEMMFSNSFADSVEDAELAEATVAPLVELITASAANLGLTLKTSLI